jgi:hypothetical protein
MASEIELEWHFGAGLVSLGSIQISKFRAKPASTLTQIHQFFA